MNNRLYTIPKWMEILKDDSMLRTQDIFEITGYKGLTQLNKLIELKHIPPPTKKSKTALGSGRHGVNLWRFGDVKKFVLEHNKNIAV